MLKFELLQQLIAAEKVGKSVVALTIHMVGGENEVIINPNISAKRAYIERAYDDELHLRTCHDIYIIDVETFTSMPNLSEIKFTENLSFSQAFAAVKKGAAMRLPQWKPDVMIRAQYPDKHSKMTAPYLYVESRFGRVPWKETMIELFSEEWEIVWTF